MKKIVIIFVILLVLSGCVFFFGWIQFSIPPNTLGLGFSKSSGWDKTVMKPGSFVWRWEKLVPTNFTLSLFPQTVYSVPVSSRGELPSSKAFSTFLDNNQDFHYDVQLKVAYSIRPEAFPRLAAEEALVPEGLEKWAEAKSLQISLEAMDTVLRLVEDEAVPDSRSGLTDFIRKKIKTALAAKFTDLDILSADLETAVFPDMALYRKGKDLYFLSLEAKKTGITEDAQKSASEILKEERRLETLKKYGELLTQYPILIEYLALEKIDKVQFSDFKNLKKTEGN